MDGTELPGFKKKSFSLFYGNGEIWAEHLDGIYEYSDLVIKKLNMDYLEFRKPSRPSLIAINLDETKINDEIVTEICRLILLKERIYSKIVFVGVDFFSKIKIRRLLKDMNCLIGFIDDFEKAKEWLIER